MKFCTDVETSTESLYSGYGELLDMPLCLCWLNVSLHIKVIITKRRFVKYRTLRTELTK
ncbi:hypothetical protein Gohar_020614 [Gossypium harknessii]|uniref:Uncharacterized protein n=1 Tax=Gossypium harknessii TaxID=34285 RepID=A0A7J9HY68_9ROSI|nr:hypothetical protein [Gossypium harknessii]